jgi:hypothetical protein
MKFTTTMFLCASALCLQGYGENGVTQNKNITVLSGQSTADGTSEVRERVLDECIVSLPKAEDLEAVVAADARYLKEINGNPAQNDFVKVYLATIDINYMVYQKTLFIVTTSSVPALEPNMKVMEKNIPRSKRFESISSNGDLYAGRSRREYYFSTAEAATADARKQATIWLKQQAAIVCKPAASK